MIIPSSSERRARGCSDAPVLFDEDMAELSLLLPGWQAAALERAARSSGLTTGQMLRRLVRDFLAVSDASYGARLPG
jgi:hypothetical protein